jgi:hypothetical protein
VALAASGYHQGGWSLLAPPYKTDGEFSFPREVLSPTFRGFPSGWVDWLKAPLYKTDGEFSIFQECPAPRSGE